MLLIKQHLVTFAAIMLATMAIAAPQPAVTSAPPAAPAIASPNNQPPTPASPNNQPPTPAAPAKTDPAKTDPEKIDYAMLATALTMKQQLCTDSLINLDKKDHDYYGFFWKLPEKQMLNFGIIPQKIIACGSLAMPKTSIKPLPAVNTTLEDMLGILEAISAPLAKGKDQAQVDTKPFAKACVEYTKNVGNKKPNGVTQYGDYGATFKQDQVKDKETLLRYQIASDDYIKRVLKLGCDGSGKDGKDVTDATLAAFNNANRGTGSGGGSDASSLLAADDAAKKAAEDEANKAKGAGGVVGGVGGAGGGAGGAGTGGGGGGGGGRGGGGTKRTTGANTTTNCDHPPCATTTTCDHPPCAATTPTCAHPPCATNLPPPITPPGGCEHPPCQPPCEKPPCPPPCDNPPCPIDPGPPVPDGNNQQAWLKLLGGIKPPYLIQYAPFSATVLPLPNPLGSKCYGSDELCKHVADMWDEIAQRRQLFYSISGANVTVAQNQIDVPDQVSTWLTDDPWNEFGASPIRNDILPEGDVCMAGAQFNVQKYRRTFIGIEYGPTTVVTTIKSVTCYCVRPDHTTYTMPPPDGHDANIATWQTWCVNRKE